MDNTGQKIFHDMKTSKVTSFITPKIIAIFIGVILVGIATGYGVSRIGGSAAVPTTTSNGGSAVSAGVVYGSNDTATFKDIAQGVLQAGGIDGEGQYHLVRPGGDSQNVYLTSSLVDLSQFTGRTIKVWGQTQAAQHAGWLMDVGRVQLIK